MGWLINNVGENVRYLLCCCVILVACSQNEPDQSLDVAKRGVLASALSANGSYAVIGSLTEGGWLWDVTKEQHKSWNHQEKTYSTLLHAAFSSDTLYAVTSDDHSIVLWDMISLSALRHWNAPSEILDIALAPKPKSEALPQLALLGLRDGTAVTFKVMIGGIDKVFQHEAPVRSVALSADGRRAITGSEDLTAVIWDVQTGKRLGVINHEEEVQLVAISPDGKYALSMAKYDKVVLWDIDQKKAMDTLGLSEEKLKRGLRLTAAAFSSDNRFLLLGLSNREVQLWQLPELKMLEQWVVPKRSQWQPTSAAITSAAFVEPGVYRVIASNGFIHTLERSSK